MATIDLARLGRAAVWLTLGAGLALILASVGLWGHFSYSVVAAGTGFGLRELAPCLVAGGGVCGLPVCDAGLSRWIDHLPDGFWAGLGLLGLGLVGRSFGTDS